MSFNDLSNKRYGMLTVIKVCGKKSYGDLVWLCKCDCGGQIQVIRSNLTRTTHCGCKESENRSASKTTHGCSHLAEYGIWKAMISRCGNPEDAGYPGYGGRGIYVCEEWKASVETFIEEMGLRPSKKHSLDRKDNDGPYCRENCRWATGIEQANNTRRNNVIECFGLTMTMVQWSRHTGVSVDAIRKRIGRGFRLEEALTAPATRKIQRHCRG